MKKLVRLTENDLESLIKNILLESESEDEDDSFGDDFVEKSDSELDKEVDAEIKKQKEAERASDKKEEEEDKIVLPTDPEVRFYHEPEPEPEFADDEEIEYEGVPIERIDGKFVMIAQDENPKITLKSKSYNKLIAAYNELWDIPYGEHKRWAMERGEYDFTNAHINSDTTLDSLPFSYTINEAVKKAIRRYLK